MTRPPVRHALAMLALLAAAALVAAGCGLEEEHEVKEGEPLELGDASYNVQLTRFLNPNDAEDAEYLVGQPDPPKGEEYLAVFMKVHNEGDSAIEIPTDFTVEDTQDNVYRPVPSNSPYALGLGSELGAGGEIPRPDTTAAAGPTQGAMVLFLVKEESTENRPLDLIVPADGEPGKVELDI